MKPQEFAALMEADDHATLLNSGWAKGREGSGTACYNAPYERSLPNGGKHFLHQHQPSKDWVLQHAPGQGALRTRHVSVKDAIHHSKSVETKEE